MKSPLKQIDAELRNLAKNLKTSEKNYQRLMRNITVILGEVSQRGRCWPGVDPSKDIHLL